MNERNSSAADEVMIFEMETESINQFSAYRFVAEDLSTQIQFIAVGDKSEWINLQPQNGMR